MMERLAANIERMESELVRRGVPSLRWGSPCMPVVCGSAERSYAVSAEMRRRGYYIAPITYPAVPEDQQGLRLTVTAAHAPEQIRRVVEELESVLAGI